MILRKPYAFFIKIFKPIHLILGALVVFLIYRTTDILSFLNEYIYSNESVIGKPIREMLISKELFIIPIIMIVLSLLFLGIMFNKKKPILFYIVTTFGFLAILVITIYSWSFLGKMEEIIVAIKIVKLIHDLIVINIIIEVISFIFFIVRGLGINFKKFNFNSDISNIDIEDSDREEFELNLDVDVDAARRKRKRRLRFLMYTYRENKFLINLSIIIVFIVTVSASFFFLFNREKELKEGAVYSVNNFNIKVNKTIILDENFWGEKITDKKLVIVDVSLRSNSENISLFQKNFSLQVENEVFFVETKYDKQVIDLGNTYENQTLTSEYENYLFIFEVPEKYLDYKMFFSLSSGALKTKITLNPKKNISQEFNSSKKIEEELSFKESLGEISFLIKNFEIKEKFLIKYNFCVEKDECIVSKEYIEPTINQDFDKTVLKLVVDYKNESKIKIDNFYDLFFTFGIIEYKIGETWFSQKNNFEKLKSKKVNNKNNIYIGVNKDILNADSIKIVFNIRSSKYEYILR